jgi:hypothetical protein
VAEKAVLTVDRTNPSARREEQALRRNRRIAIKQLERAELYIVALYSLDLGEEAVQGVVDDLVRDVRGLRQHLVRSRLTA